MTVAAGEEGGRRPEFGAELRAVLAERDFRKLFASRLVSQTGDGVFNAGFAAYAFFSAQSFPNPAAAVDAFAVLYLPYSLIGPFAGVFIDRWSRRQIIVYGALIRAAMVAVAGFVVLSGQTGIPLYISALAVLAVNRFFLSAVSAGTPHVVSRGQAGDGERRRAHPGHDPGVRRRRRRPRRPLHLRRRPGRQRGRALVRRRLLPGGRAARHADGQEPARTA